MDPDENLKQQIALCEKLSGEEHGDDVDRLVELVLALHEWLTRGGFPPKAWHPFDRKVLMSVRMTLKLNRARVPDEIASGELVKLRNRLERIVTE